MDEAFTAEERTLLEQARTLVPMLAERSGVTNAARDVVPETIADFHRTGILRIIQPRRFGGLQLRFSLFSRIVEILTEGCASSGWVSPYLANISGCSRRIRCKRRSTCGATIHKQSHHPRSRHAPWPNVSPAAGG